MKLGQLTSTYLGRTVTISGSGESVSGVLTEVIHRTALIETTTFGSSEPTYEVGATGTEVTIGGWNGRSFHPDSDCEVEGLDTSPPDPAKYCHPGPPREHHFTPYTHTCMHCFQRDPSAPEHDTLPEEP